MRAAQAARLTAVVFLVIAAVLFAIAILWTILYWGASGWMIIPGVLAYVGAMILTLLAFSDIRYAARAEARWRAAGRTPE